MAEVIDAVIIDEENIEASLIEDISVDASVIASDIIRLGFDENYKLSEDDMTLIAAQVKLPTATRTTKGVVKVGNRLSIGLDGTLSADDEEILTNLEIEELLNAMA